jgi:hypothetical protein
VVIYRFITCGTIEEKIYRKQIFKGALARQTTDKKGSQFRYFTHNELRDLFKLDNAGLRSTTQLQLADIHKKQCNYSKVLFEHIRVVQAQCSDIVGLSDHDLLFTKDDELHDEVAHALEASQEAHESLKRLVASTSTPSPHPSLRKKAARPQLLPDDFTILNDEGKPRKKRVSVARKLSLGLGLIDDDDSDVDSGNEAEVISDDEEDMAIPSATEISDSSDDEGFVANNPKPVQPPQEVYVVDSSSEDEDDDEKEDEEMEDNTPVADEDSADDGYITELTKAHKHEMSGDYVAAIDGYMK